MTTCSCSRGRVLSAFDPCRLRQAPGGGTADDSAAVAGAAAVTQEATGNTDEASPPHRDRPHRGTRGIAPTRLTNRGIAAPHGTISHLPGVPLASLRADEEGGLCAVPTRRDIGVLAKWMRRVPRSAQGLRLGNHRKRRNQRYSDTAGNTIVGRRALSPSTTRA
jgi:hypothetical protein